MNKQKSDLIFKKWPEDIMSHKNKYLINTQKKYANLTNFEKKADLNRIFFFTARLSKIAKSIKEMILSITREDVEKRELSYTHCKWRCK